MIFLLRGSLVLADVLQLGKHGRDGCRVVAGVLLPCLEPNRHVYRHAYTHVHRQTCIYACAQTDMHIGMCTDMYIDA